MHKYVTINKHVPHLGSFICNNSYCVKEVIRVESIEMEGKKYIVVILCEFFYLICI